MTKKKPNKKTGSDNDSVRWTGALRDVIPPVLTDEPVVTISVQDVAEATGVPWVNASTGERGVPLGDAPLQPVGKRGGKGFVFELDKVWTERLERLADASGATSAGYLLTLLRRAWTSLPRSLRRDDDPPHPSPPPGDDAA